MAAASSHVVHIDDVEVIAREKGELRSARRFLGEAAGATIAGLSLWEIAPGFRSTPAHVHADEEEIFWVLRGSGLSWQDGKTYRVSAGDCLIHRCEGEAHTLIAGEEGLDVLAFAEGSRTSLTWLPRTQMMWAGGRWIPTDAPHPFKVEAEAGPLPIPDEPEAERPPTIVAFDDAPVSERDREQVRTVRRAYAGDRTGMKHVTVEPGAWSSLLHCHSAEEELFYVLGGAGEVQIGEERLPVRAGHVVARPPGTGLSHRFLAGDDGLELLAWGHRIPSDTAFYPETNKVYLRGLDAIFRVEPVDYWG